MATLLLIAVLAASALVVASGIWVAVALIGALWRVDGPGSVPSNDAGQKSTPQSR